MNPFKVSVKNPETNVVNVVEIVEYTPTEGPGAGKTKLRPADFSEWNLKKLIDLWGAEKVYSVICKSKAAQLCTNFTVQATTRTEEVKEGTNRGQEIEVPETDEAVIIKTYSDMFSQLSLRGESPQAIGRRLNEILQDEMPRLADLLLFPKTPLPQAEREKLTAQLVALKTERAELEKTRENLMKSRKKNVEEDQEEAKAA